ncbi:unnamed protein product, partial [Brachionus calyciflorus]
MASSTEILKNAVEEFIRQSLKSKFFKSGDGMAREIAGWKWLNVICRRFLVEKSLYRQLVKEFTFSLVDVDTCCRICKSTVELDELWDHVERCMEVRCLNYWGERQTSEKVDCPICEKSFRLIEFSDHAENCKWNNCETCGERYKKLEKGEHMVKCEPAVVTLKECPNCPERLEMKDVERHLRECSERMRVRRCKICGEREERGHNFHECPIRLEKKPVKDWVIFRRCGHVVCRACSRGLKLVTEPRTVVYGLVATGALGIAKYKLDWIDWGFFPVKRYFFANEKNEKRYKKTNSGNENYPRSSNNYKRGGVSNLGRGGLHCPKVPTTECQDSLKENLGNLNGFEGLSTPLRPDCHKFKLPEQLIKTPNKRPSQEEIHNSAKIALM